jgi:hypothetical protein
VTGVVAAAVAVVVLAGLAVLQLMVASGRPLGRFVWGGQHDVLPRRWRVGSAVSVLVYAAIAVVLLWRATTTAPVPGAVTVAVWVLAGYFALGVALNGLSRSRSERLVMTPVCVALTACSVLVATA